MRKEREEEKTGQGKKIGQLGQAGGKKLADKEKLGLGPDRGKREFFILFPSSNPKANQIKFEYDLKYTF